MIGRSGTEGKNGAEANLTPTSPGADRGPADVGPLKRIVRALGPTAGLSLALLVVVVGFSVSQDVFFTYGNIVNILRVSAVPMIIAMGMTFVVLTAGADLSVGSTMALCGVGLGLLLTSGISLTIAVPLTLVLGGALGLLNGWLIGIVRMSFFVVTLATLSAYRGLALVMTDGRSVQVAEYDQLRFVGDGSIGPVPVAVVIGGIVVLLSWYFARQTSWGRSVYAVGSNRKAATLAGIRVKYVEVSVYTVSGLLAALAAVIQVGRLTTASPSVGVGLELEVVAAVLLGGTLLSGGTGGVVGTILGVLLIAVVQNGLSISGVAQFWQGVVTGVILVMAVYLDRLQRDQVE